MVKNFGGEKLWKRRKAEKSKTDFPALLGNPANTARDSHFPTASAAAVYVTNSFRTKGDISILVSKGTFLNWYDTRAQLGLTHPERKPKIAPIILYTE